jgi:hypothetical protein
VESQLERDNANNHDESPALLWGDDGENEAGAHIADGNEAGARSANSNETRKRGMAGFYQSVSDGWKARRQALDIATNLREMRAAGV